ncbi:uncharacterized protein [Oscarella lobularis]|uniref:uncharacterized protein isoform X2 n=1 Tax=Oscarella lobularis TaxID=121494 RepID=UPI0033139630
MFDRFQDGATYLKQSDTQNQLFKGKLAVVCKDVSSGDSNSVLEEMVKKILEVLKTDMENNFVKNLYRGSFRVATSENFGKREFFESFVNIRKHFDTQQSLGSAKYTSELMKTVLAKIYLQDWTALDRTKINKVLILLRMNVEDAVWCGSLLDGNEIRPLGKFESDKEVVEDKELPMSLSAKDHGFVLYAAAAKDRSHLRERLIKGYCAINEKHIGTTDWCSSFRKQLTALVNRRISRVEKWIHLNTQVFKDDIDVTSLLLDTKLRLFSPLRQFWSLCEQKCQTCDRLCLEQSPHNKEDVYLHHDCHTNHKCEYKCSYFRDSSGKGVACGFPCGHCGGHTGKHQCKERKHICNTPCELSAYRGCKGSCSRKVDHVKAEDEQSRLHRCDAEIHCCNKKCDLSDCKNHCSLPYNHKGRHQCTMDYCPKSCVMHSCSNRCGSSNHFHSLDIRSIHICKTHEDCANESTFAGIRSELFGSRRFVTAHPIRRHVNQLQEELDRLRLRLQENERLLQISRRETEEERIRANEVHRAKDEERLQAEITLREKDELRMNLELEREQNRVAREQLEAQCDQLRQEKAEIQGVADEKSESLRKRHLLLEIPSEDVRMTSISLGSGAYGSVKMGYWRGSYVAVKSMHDLLDRGHYLELFQQEIGICSHARHPNVVSLCGVTTEDGVPARIITELLEGSVSDVIKASRRSAKRLSLREQVDMAVGFTAGIAYLHQLGPKGILHGDICPRNVVVSTLMEAKVCDLGAARFSEASKMISAGLLSPEYVAPERRDSH